MPRLQAYLASPEGEVRVALRFYRDDTRRPVVDGSLQTTLVLVCQRCMGRMDLDLDLRVALGIVQSEEQAERLDEDREPLLLDEDTIRLSELVEDELILGLPTIAMHPANTPACNANKVAGPKSKEMRANGKQAPARDENPFAVLSALKPGAGTDKD